jgi:hypothetical protein
MNEVRDNEIRALARMQTTYDVMKTCYPADNNIMSEWHRVSNEIRELIKAQETSIEIRKNDLT